MRQETFQFWSLQWLVACSTPRLNLNQCWFVFNWAHSSKNWINMWRFPCKEMILKMSSGKWPPFCLSLIMLSHHLRRNLATKIDGYHTISKGAGGWLGTSVETKWQSFCRRRFEFKFIVCELSHFDSNFTDLCTPGSIINKPAMLQILAWCRIVDPLCEPSHCVKE